MLSNLSALAKEGGFGGIRQLVCEANLGGRGAPLAGV